MNTDIESNLENLGERLVTLSDGRKGLRGGIRAEVKAPSDAGDLPILEFTASDETLDRYNEIITVAGWQLDNYQKNPVFQNSHMYGDILFTLGKATRTEVKNGALVQRVEFATELNPMAKIAYGLYKGGFLNAVSVGFIPLKWQNGSGGDTFARKYTSQELLEVSAVSIPANPNALVMGLKSGAIEERDVRETLELLAAWRPTEFSGKTKTTPDANTGDLGAAGNESQLLQCARDFSQVLKRA